jgi:xylose isomerase
MPQARAKADAAFDRQDILGVPFYCVHDADIRHEGAIFAETYRNLNEIVDYLGQKPANDKTQCLWGKANLFDYSRWMSGATTNPDPDIYAYAATTVKANMDATHALGRQP